MDVHPTKNVSIGIDPYPYLVKTIHNTLDACLNGKQDDKHTIWGWFSK
jgi:hypothetical protein